MTLSFGYEVRIKFNPDELYEAISQLIAIIEHTKITKPALTDKRRWVCERTWKRLQSQSICELSKGNTEFYVSKEAASVTCSVIGAGEWCSLFNRNSVSANSLGVNTYIDLTDATDPTEDISASIPYTPFEDALWVARGNYKKSMGEFNVAWVAHEDNDPVGLNLYEYRKDSVGIIDKLIEIYRENMQRFLANAREAAIAQAHQAIIQAYVEKDFTEAAKALENGRFVEFEF